MDNESNEAKSLQDFRTRLEKLKERFEALRRDTGSYFVELNNNVLSYFQPIVESDSDTKPKIEEIKDCFANVIDGFDGDQDTLQEFINLEMFITDYEKKHYNTQAYNNLTNGVTDMNCQRIEDLKDSVIGLKESINPDWNSEFYTSLRKYAGNLAEGIDRLKGNYRSTRSNLIEEYTQLLNELNQYVSTHGRPNPVAALFDDVGGEAEKPKEEPMTTLEAIRIASEQAKNIDESKIIPGL